MCTALKGTQQRQKDIYSGIDSYFSVGCILAVYTQNLFTSETTVETCVLQGGKIAYSLIGLANIIVLYLHVQVDGPCSVTSMPCSSLVQ